MLRFVTVAPVAVPALRPTLNEVVLVQVNERVDVEVATAPF
jgi:hypothetical protein